MSFVRYEGDYTYNADGYEESRDYIGGSETQEGITRYFGPDWADLGQDIDVSSRCVRVLPRRKSELERCVPDPTDPDVSVSIDVPDNFVSLAPQFDQDDQPILDEFDQQVYAEETYVISKDFGNGGELIFVDYLGEISGYLNYWTDIEEDGDGNERLTSYEFELQNSEGEWIGATNFDLVSGDFKSELKLNYVDENGDQYYWDEESYDNEDILTGFNTEPSDGQDGVLPMIEVRRATQENADDNWQYSFEHFYALTLDAEGYVTSSKFVGGSDTSGGITAYYGPEDENGNRQELGEIVDISGLCPITLSQDGQGRWVETLEAYWPSQENGSNEFYVPESFISENVSDEGSDTYKISEDKGGVATDITYVDGDGIVLGYVQRWTTDTVFGYNLQDADRMFIGSSRTDLESGDYDSRIELEYLIGGATVYWIERPSSRRAKWTSQMA